jgi:hypothetical protein
MNTNEIKRAKIKEITDNGRAENMRRNVWRYLRAMGASTTDQIASRMGMSVLSVRPRVTELLQLGLARLTGKIHSNGVYEAIEAEDALQMTEEPLHANEQLKFGVDFI